MRRCLYLALVVLLFAGTLPVAAQKGGSHPPITPENASQLTQVGMVGTGLVRDLRWSEKHIAVVTTVGVWLYQPDALDSPPRFLPSAGAPMADVALSPDGNLLVISDLAQARVWDVETGTLIKVLQDDTDRRYTQVEFSPDSRTLAAAQNYDIVLYDVATWTPTLTLTAQSNWINALAFSPDGTRLASGNGDAYTSGSAGYVRDDTYAYLWDITTGAQLLRIEHYNPVCDVAFSSNGILLVTTGSLFQWMLLDHWNGSVSAVPHPVSEASQNIIVRDSYGMAQAYLTAEGFPYDAHNIQLRAAWSNQELMTLDVVLPHLGVGVLNSDRTILATLSSDGVLRLWDVQTGKPQQSIPVQPLWGVLDIAFSPDGQSLAAVDSYDNYSLTVWDLSTREQTFRRSDPLIIPVEVAFQPDGTLVSGEWLERADGEHQTPQERPASIRLWDVQTGELKKQLSPVGVVWVTDLSPDGRWMVSIDYGDILFYDLDTGENVARFQGHNFGYGSAEFINNVAFSSDGRFLVSSARDHSIRLWAVNLPGVARGTQLDQIVDWTNSLAISPDGSLLAFNDPSGPIYLWSIETNSEGELSFGEQVAVFEGNTSWTKTLAFSPDGALLASGGDDYQVRVWNVQTGELLVVLSGLTVVVLSVAFSPDGSLLVSASLDGTIRQWAVSDTP